MLSIELRDVIYLGATLMTGVVMLVKLDSASKEQTKQHGELKTAVDKMTTEVKALGRDASSHEARLDNVEGRVDRVETRVDLIARRM